MTREKMTTGIVLIVFGVMGIIFEYDKDPRINSAHRFLFGGGRQPLLWEKWIGRFSSMLFLAAGTAKILASL